MVVRDKAGLSQILVWDFGLQNVRNELLAIFTTSSDILPQQSSAWSHLYMMRAVWLSGMSCLGHSSPFLWVWLRWWRGSWGSTNLPPHLGVLMSHIHFFCFSRQPEQSVRDEECWVCSWGRSSQVGVKWVLQQPMEQFNIFSLKDGGFVSGLQVHGGKRSILVGNICWYQNPSQQMIADLNSSLNLI